MSSPYQNWSEHKHQSKFVGEARKILRPLGLRDMLFAIPNGGKRDTRTAATLKTEGVVSGIPDLMLAVPRGGFHGAFFEMKDMKKGKTSSDQDRIIPQLNEAGYWVVVCKGWQEALDSFKIYMDL